MSIITKLKDQKIFKNTSNKTFAIFRNGKIYIKNRYYKSKRNAITMATGCNYFVFLPN